MRLSIIFSIALLLSSVVLASDKDALLTKLYKKAFLKKAGQKKDNSIYLPLIVNGVEHTEVFALIDDINVYIKEEDVKYILSLFNKKDRRYFNYQKAKNGYVDISFLNQKGVEAIYDDKYVILKLSIPPKLKAPTSINLSYRKLKDINGSIKPKTFSGAVNLYFNQYYNSSNPQKKFERKKLSASSEMFFNLKKFVLEGRVRYKEGDKNEFIRDRVRVVRDIEQNDLRVVFGDTYLPKHNRQSYVDSFGLSVEKIFSISNSYNKNAKRMNSYEFFLQDSSSVEIYVNDKFIRRLHLKSGTYNIHDLDLPAGLTDVRLKIIEDSGKVEILTFDDFAYSDLLRKGFIKYGFGYGITSQKDSNDKIQYNKDDNLLSLYADYGLTNNITLKSGFQSKDRYKSTALDLFLGTQMGIFDFYGINSKSEFLNIDGNKYGLEYRTNIGKINFSLYNELSQKDYTTLSTYKTNTTRYKITSQRASIYAPLQERLNLSLSGSIHKKDNETTKKYSASLTKNFLHSSYLQLSYEYEKNLATEVKKDKIYLTLNYKFDNNSNARYSKYFSNENRQNFNLNHRTDGYYNTSYSLDFEDGKNADKYTLRTNIKNEKFRLNTSYDYTNASDNSKILSLQLETGLVFAGSSFTISEPITSSFIIVENDDKISDKPLGIVGFHSTEEYKYKTYTLPLGNHSMRTLNTDESDLDMGTDLYEPMQKFITNYKSGSVMNLYIKSLYSVKGILVDQKGNPISLRAFKIFNIDRDIKEMAFTNKKGEFLIQNIESGRYNAVLFRGVNDSANSKFSFTLDEDKLDTNIITLGKVVVKLAPKKEVKKYLIHR